jgi:glutamyl-tRNA synthetase
VEDTDQKRFDPDALRGLYEALNWSGLDWDEGPDKGGSHGPYVQSERLELYQKWAEWLVEQGKAYRAYDTPEELAQINEERKARKLPPGYDNRHRDLTSEQEQQFIDEGRKPVIRFRAPDEGKTVVNDLVRGEVEFDNKTVQDMVLLKSDGFPTYHLAVVIDDHFMEITHVMRGIEWLPSLPLHIHLWEAFGWEQPHYAHLPIILNPDGKGKLSKRKPPRDKHGNPMPVMVNNFKDDGYVPEAILNFLFNIGWNFGDEREVFSVEEAIERFGDLKRVNPANSAYPPEKLEWLNGIYIREKMSSDELAEHLRGPLEDAGYDVDMDLLRQVAPLVQTRIKTFNDVVDMAGFFFAESFSPPSVDHLVQKKMDAESTRDMLEKSYEVLKDWDDWSHEATYERMKQFAQDHELKNGQVFGGLRVAVTGQRISTPTFETMEILGKEESLRRIRIGIDLLGEAVLTNSRGE